MKRRHFLSAAALGAMLGVKNARALGTLAPSSRIRAAAFDGFAIFDPRPVGAVAEAVFPGKGPDFMTAWRARQFEYTWLRTLTGHYTSFWHVTEDALDFACSSLHLTLSSDNRMRLMQAYLQLKPWPDVLPALRRLRGAGVRLAILSNFTAAMLDANFEGTGLGEFFEVRLSTDEVSAFKPDPRSYQMAVDRLALPRSSILFVAYAGWDAAGAAQFGMPVYWVNRLAQPAENLGAQADFAATSLGTLPEFIR